jgi:hypothetical protein
MIAADGLTMQGTDGRVSQRGGGGRRGATSTGTHGEDISGDLCVRVTDGEAGCENGTPLIPGDL